MRAAMGGRGGDGAALRAVRTYHTYEKDGRYFSPKPQHDGDPNMKAKGMDNENTGRTAKRLTRPMTLPRMPSGVVPWAIAGTRRVRDQ